MGVFRRRGLVLGLVVACAACGLGVFAVVSAAKRSPRPAFAPRAVGPVGTPSRHLLGFGDFDQGLLPLGRGNRGRGPANGQLPPTSLRNAKAMRRLIRMSRAPRSASTAKAAMGAAASSPRSGSPIVPTGALTEVPSFRREYSDTYVGANGVDVAHVYSRPVNYRASDGSWEPIDDTLVKSGSGFVNRADSYGVDLPSDLGSGLVHVSADGKRVSMRLVGARSALASVSGSTATYADALPGVSVSDRADAEGVEESFSLSRRDAPRQFKVELGLSPGLHAVEHDGTVAIEDAAGSVMFSMPTPVMSQAPASAGQPPWPSLAGSVAVSMASTSGGVELTYTPDHAWLDAPGRRFPVVLDPAFLYHVTSDCTLVQAFPTSTAYCGQGGYDYFGNAPGTGSQYHTILSFPGLAQAIPADSQVLGAGLNMYVAAVTGATSYFAVPMTDTFTTYQGSWTYRDTATGLAWSNPGGGGDYVESGGLPDVIGGGTIRTTGSTYFAMTALAQAWVDGSYLDNDSIVPSVMLAGVSGAGNEVGIDSLASGNGPYLDISYSARLGNDPGSTVQKTQLTKQLGMGVNVANGDFMLHNTDMSIAGTGLDETIDRSYNSLTKTSGGLFGAGWGTTDAEIPTLEPYAYDDQVLTLPDGNEEVWDVDPSVTGEYIAPPGVDGTLCAPAYDASCTSDTPTATYVLTFDDSGEQWDFGLDGQLLADYDTNGNKISYSYNANGSPASITDTHNRQTTFSYSGADIGIITDVAGARHTSYVQNSAGELTSYTDAANNTTHYGYNSSGLLSQITDQNGDVTNLTYDGDGSGRVASIDRITNQPVAGDGDTTTYAYYAATTPPPNGYPACGSDPGGEQPYGYTIETSPSPDLHWTVYCYDTHDRVYQTIDEYGNRTTTTYDADDDVTNVTYPPLGTTTITASTSYDNCFRPIVSTQPTSGSEGAPTTTTGYDYKPESQDPYTGSTPCAETPGAGYQPTSVVNPAGNTIKYGYDTHGNLLQVSDGLPSGENTLNLTYYPDGQMETSENANLQTTAYGYTSQNLTSVAPPIPLQPQTYGYDADSRRMSSTDGDGNQTTYKYDPDDNVTLEGYQGGASTTNVYDGDGNLKSATDSSTGTTAYVYDAKNRLMSETDPGAGGQPSTTTTYGYDGDNNLTSLTDAGGTVNYSYNDDDRVSSIQEPSPATKPISFTYDADNRLICTTYPNDNVVQKSYDAAGNILSIQAARGASAACNPNSTTGTPIGTVFSNYEYTYQNNGDTNTDLRQTLQINGGATWTYYYDALDRLSEAKPSTGTTLYYSYDGDGNLLTRTNPTTGATQTLSYNNDDEINTTGYNYDTAGNLQATPGSTTLGYNTRSQTTSINPAGAGAQTLSYNGDGQTHPAQIGNQPTGGEAPALEENTLGISAQEAAVASGGKASDTYYTRAPDGTLLGERTPVADYYYIEDANGSVTELTGPLGLPDDTYTYDPYGTTTSSTVLVPNSFGYDGGYQAQDGLDLFGARYYNPTTGNWTQPDPLTQNDPTAHLDDPIQIDNYAFAGDDPVNQIDPTGSCIIVCAVFHWVVGAVNWAIGAVHTVVGVTVSELGKCGLGALKGVIGVGGGTVLLKIVNKGAGNFLLTAVGVAGVRYAWLAAAAAGCAASL